MITEGWSIVNIPVVDIEAENEREAKKLLLLVSSRYGHVTEEGFYEFISLSELDWEELKTEIDLPEIDIKKFEDGYFKSAPVDAEPQIDRAEELNQKWQIKTGDLWQIGEHRLLCGDSTNAGDVGRVLGNKKADLCLTDPPYGIGEKYQTYDDSEENLKKLIKGWFPIAQEFSICLLFTPGNKHQWFYPQPSWVLGWFTGGGSGMNPWGFTSWHAIYAYGKDPYLTRGLGSRPDALNLISTEDEQTGHPSQKPIRVWQWILERGSPAENELILDPFLGSGTTMVACQNLNRKCRAIEISPAYCAVTLERMATAFPGIDIKRIEA